MDALYSLPTILELCKKHDCKADFYTSPHCAPMKSLMEYQDCINEVIVTPDFTNDWSMTPADVGFSNIPEGKYEAFYDLSFKTFPNCCLPDFMAREVGVKDRGPIKYKVPGNYKKTGYLCLAPRTNRSPEFSKLFESIAVQAGKPVVVVGGPGEMLRSPYGQDLTHLSMLDMADVIAGADGFVGVLSAPLVLAHGFDVPKVVVHDGVHIGLNHIVRDSFTKYLANPMADQVLEALK